MPVSESSKPHCDLLLTGIACLATAKGSKALLATDFSTIDIILDAAIAVTDGKIQAVGPKAQVEANWSSETHRDLNCRLLTPALVDCHTHPVFVRSRANEFEMRLKGATYQSIMEQGGGILSSVRGVREASEEELGLATERNLSRLHTHGVGVAECKSGYGLSKVDEIRSLEAIAQCQGHLGMHLTATCLAAHVFPSEFRDDREGYVDLVCNEILPEVADRKLADAADVFVEKGAFSGEEARRIIDKAHQLGLLTHAHADQLEPGEGTKIAVECGARSADHLEFVDDETISAMAEAGTCAVLLPGSTYHLKQTDWAPARKLIDAGVPTCLATDFNPGSSPIANPAFIMSLACLKLNMTPIEALNAFTLNAAYCLNLGHSYGTIEPGKAAVFTLWDLDHPAEIPYYAGSNMVRDVLVCDSPKTLS